MLFQLLFSLFLVTPTTPAFAANAAVEIDPTIMVFNEYDWDRCEKRVQQAKNDGASRVNLLLTLGFVEGKNAAKPSGYCYFRKGGSCVPFTRRPLIREYTKKIRGCLRSISRAGLAVTITPHLDDSSRAGRWRNNVVFDPFDKLKFGYSYYQVMLLPILRAVKHSFSHQSAVEIAFEGEMGATVGHYPEEYSRLFYSMHQKMEAWPQLQFGISLNFNQVFGENFEPKKVSQLQQLLNQVDFVGFSNYNKVDYPATPKNFANGVDSWLSELAGTGLTIPEGKPIHFTEIGLGGGTGGDEKTPASDPTLSASVPFSGVRGAYVQALDPWQNQTMKDFRLQYYQTLGDFLDHQVSDWKVTRVFTWNSDSWDVNGLYTAKYRDPQIVEYIKNFNHRN